ncbi:hypothetical protein SKAU_G00036400 [Synaphobranchus kaupii]|uniref:Uncharacterized protein n=1 Tax=Synaphobranchus kaupii TaxID=118154 RepID=A0A9Q1GH34_SYNKA|nr:hypothetical protein SKAU_G00036400 [Synaphobranchus kaupii]
MPHGNSATTTSSVTMTTARYSVSAVMATAWLQPRSMRACSRRGRWSPDLIIRRCKSRRRRKVTPPPPACPPSSRLNITSSLSRRYHEVIHKLALKRSNADNKPNPGTRTAFAPPGFLVTPRAHKFEPANKGPPFYGRALKAFTYTDTQG